MATETVRLDWVHDRVFLLRDRFGFPIVMTQPMGVNGADLLPLSVIGCAAWDVLAILRKQRQPVTRLHVTAESEREAEAPWRFTRMRLRYRLAGANLSEDRVRHAIELAETRYCSTLITLRAAVPMESAFEIRDTGADVPDLAEAAAEQDSTDEAAAVVRRFNDALNRGDVDGMARLLTEDTVFENTYPPPAGERFVGRAAVRAFWEGFFRASREPRIEVEEILALGQRCVMRWTYHWLGADGQAGHVRGIDLYTVRDGLIAEKLSYVKG